MQQSPSQGRQGVCDLPSPLPLSQLQLNSKNPNSDQAHLSCLDDPCLDEEMETGGAGELVVLEIQCVRRRCLPSPGPTTTTTLTCFRCRSLLVKTRNLGFPTGLALGLSISLSHELRGLCSMWWAPMFLVHIQSFAV